MAVQVKTYLFVSILLTFLSVSFSLTYHYGDGSYYVGSVDGEGRPMEGVQYNKEGYVRYNGSYVGGLYHGEGSWFGDVGDSFQGQFRRGEANGRGVWNNLKTWNRIEGMFENGTLSGQAVWSRPDLGVRLEGVFRRGHAHGKGVVLWDDTGYR